VMIHRWDFADGLVNDGGQERVHAFEKPGQYKPVLLLIDSKGCQVPLNEGPEIIVHDRPIIDFTTDPEFPFTGESVSLMGTSNEAALLTWRWPGHEVTQDTLTVTFENPGNMEIVLSAENGYGCDQLVRKVLVVQNDITFMPNVFTPGEVDGMNDTFKINEVEGGTWNMTIYNRWGNKVYKSNEYRNDWTGSDLSTGIYYYVMQNNLRKERQVKGFVHVMK
jgi:gliding motility-associated-like protein